MLVDEINRILLTRTGRLNTAIIRRDWFKASKLYQDIIHSTSFLPQDRSISERVFCIINNIHSLPVCSITGVPLRFLPTAKRYALVSGKNNCKHVIDYKLRNKKLSVNKKTNHSFVNNEITNSFFQKKYVLKSEKTVKEYIETKLHNTNFGTKSNFINIKDKKTQKDILCSLLFYTEHPFLTFKNIKEVNWSERFYLFINKIYPPGCLNDSQRKATFINFKKGYRNTSSNYNRLKQNIQEIFSVIVQQGFTLVDSSQSQLKGNIFTLQCNTCKKIHTKHLTNGRWKDIYCSGCYGDKNISKEEENIKAFIEQLGFSVLKNDKNILNGKEIDIYIPEKKIAIEYNGLLWHSYGTTYPNTSNLESVNKFKHLRKTEMCLQNNIQLLHIFENEWLQKPSIVKSIIKSKLGIIERKIFARKCIIKNITHLEKEFFLQENHIQGNCQSSTNLGLFFKDELVSVMTFGIRKITSSIPTTELLRFCNKIDTVVVGGASKLFSFFIKTNKPKKIISYADRRYSNGKLYQNLGFVFSHFSKPNYWYTRDCATLHHRIKFQKHKIQNQDNKFLTETQIMYDNGYRKIYDCGNFVFLHELN